MTAPGSVRAKKRAATAIAAAVPRPMGSSMIACGVIPASRSCSAAIKRCSALHRISGGEKRCGSETRRQLATRRLSAPISDKNCLGYRLRDLGHRRVPDPPQSTTGTILSIAFLPDVTIGSNLPQTVAIAARNYRASGNRHNVWVQRHRSKIFADLLPIDRIHDDDIVWLNNSRKRGATIS